MDHLTCKGFLAAGAAAGIKYKDRKDLGLIVSETPASVAAVFTTNKVKAAPVLLDQQRTASGTCRAVIANSGNANCCNGDAGMRAALSMSRCVESLLDMAPEEVLVASTGVIGEPLPLAPIQAAAPKLVKALAPEGFGDFAESIMTTDTVPKLVSVQAQAGGKPYTIIGTAKGAGMIAPNMATMLCFLCTDVKAEAVFLKAALKATVSRTLNRIVIDGDTSTNDTALIMANGMSGAVLESEQDQAAFREALMDVLMRLAKLLVKDGEGVTKLVEIKVKGAESADDAHRLAYTVANSPLFKTALFGEDANWGRIMAAAGRAGVPLNPDKVDIYFDDVMLVKQGLGCGKTAEAKATQVMKKDVFCVRIDLSLGDGRDTVFTCDFSLDYVKINADYRS